MQILNMEQGTPEWFEARKLKMTASNATAIGNCGAGLETYIYDLCAEFLSIKEKEHFSNVHTERGNELEPEARIVYEFETGNKVEQVGFCILSDYVGCSPDGFVGDAGLVEIKCPDGKTHLKTLVTKKISSGYEWQMQMQMLVTGREWCDFVSYNPNFAKNIYSARFYADKEKHDKLLAGFKKGEDLIKKIIKDIK